MLSLEIHMKRLLMGWVALSALVSTSARAEPGAELAQAKGCMMCHSVQGKLLGPAYKDIAARYAGQKGSEDKLVQKVLKGGGGVWGPAKMPPNTQLSEAEARTLVKWILSLKEAPDSKGPR
jgi:cytochrome c